MFFQGIYQGYTASNSDQNNFSCMLLMPST